MADTAPVIGPRNLLKKRLVEAALQGPPALSREEVAPKITEVKQLQRAKETLQAVVGTPLHSRIADLVVRKGRVLVAPPKAFKPSPGVPAATLRRVAALGGRMRAAKLRSTEAGRKRLSAIGRKGALAKARKRRVLLRTVSQLERKIARDRKALLKAGVAASELD